MARPFRPYPPPPSLMAIGTFFIILKIAENGFWPVILSVCQAAHQQLLIGFYLILNILNIELSMRFISKRGWQEHQGPP